MQKYFSWKAIFFGTAISLVLGLIMQVTLLFIMVGYISLTGDDPQLDGYYEYIGFSVAGLLSVLVMAIGGYVTAYIAEKNIYAHALIVSLLVSMVSLITILSSRDPTVVSMVYLVMGVGSALGGAYYWQWARQIVKQGVVELE